MEPLKHLLFIDIETACGEADHAQLSEGMQREWAIKFEKKWRQPKEDAAESYFDKAGLLAEFGRIVCISMGFLYSRGDEWKLRVRSFSGDDEKKLLEGFCSALGKFHEKHSKVTFVGHNVQEFDLPYISRRMLIHSMCLPKCMNFQGKKPWDLKEMVCDTMLLWTFGDKKDYVGLSLLAEALGIPSSKDDINGSDVTRVFWQEKDLPRIVTYCQKDVETTAKVYMRLMCYNEVAFTTEILEPAALSVSGS